jgi:HK97 family phage major capsid protein
VTTPNQEILAAIKDAVGEKMADERQKTLEKVKELDDKLVKLDGDFRRVYQAALDNPKPGENGFVERGLIMQPHESVDEYVERHGIGTGRITMAPIGLGPSGGARGAVGRVAGLAGVRDQRGLTMSRMLIAYAKSERESNFGGVNYERAAMHAKKVMRDDRVADMIKHTEEVMKKARGSGEDAELAQRALGTTTPGSGAGLVLPDYTSFFMDYLFAQTIIRLLGAMSISLKAELRIPFIDTAVTAGFRGESKGPNASKPGEGYVTMTRKLLSAIVAMSNEWLDEASYQPAVFLRNHLAGALAEHFDLRAFRGRGTNDEVRGADYWVENAGATHFANRSVDAGSSKATYKTVLKDTIEPMRIISGEKIRLGQGSPGYALQNETFYAMLRILSGSTTENRPFADELRGGTLHGAKVAVTTQFPTNQAGDGAGTGTNNKTNFYFGDWSTFAIGESQGLEIKAMDGAAYKDESGNTQLGFTNNETVIRADQRVDTVALRRGYELFRGDSNDWHAEF